MKKKLMIITLALMCLMVLTTTAFATATTQFSHAGVTTWGEKFVGFIMYVAGIAAVVLFFLAVVGQFNGGHDAGPWVTKCFWASLGCALLWKGSSVLLESFLGSGATINDIAVENYTFPETNLLCAVFLVSVILSCYIYPKKQLKKVC